MDISHASGDLFSLLFLMSSATLAINGNLRADEPQQPLLAEKVIIDFDTAEEAQNWVSINDDVMGGRSEGAFRLTRQGTLEFYGNLSLKNRGGFASVRSRPAKLPFSDFGTLEIRVRGDGRAYYCYLRVCDDRYAYSYRAKFDTDAERWQQVRLPLKKFRATWRGRAVPDAPAIDVQKIESVGFLIADKKAGPFKLEVDWIGAANEAASAP